MTAAELAREGHDLARMLAETPGLSPAFDELRELIEGLSGYVDAVEAMLAQARLVSPSASMSVYVSDIERALGYDRPVAHKLGGEQ